MLTDQLVVTNVARTGFETHMAMPREGNLYTMGMGLVTPVVLGLALSLPHRGVIALDGDGSILLWDLPARRSRGRRSASRPPGTCQPKGGQPE